MTDPERTQLELIERAGSEMARAGQAISDLAREQRKTRERVEQLEFEREKDRMEIERIAKLQEEHHNRYMCVPYFERRGFKFTRDEGIQVGRECGIISRNQFKENPRAYSPGLYEGREVNTYSRQVLEEWIIQHGHRYTRVKCQ